MRQLLQHFEKINQQHQLLQKNDGVVLGLSGGPDSVALFLLFLTLRKKFNLRLYAAHLNHRLSSNSVKFERFSENLAKRFDLPFFKKSVELKKISRKNKRTLEEAGRIERYQFFCEVAGRVRANKIATAHTLDDQAETILMHLVRGAGLKGLGGIPAKRKEARYELIRPLINVSKKEIFQFLKRSKEPYCLDPSNRSAIFTRNRVRNTLIPWIEKNMNPQIRQSLSDLGAICSRVDDLVACLAAKELRSCVVKQKKSEIRLDRSRLGRLDPAIRSEVIFQALVWLKGDRLRLGSAHLAAIHALMESSENNLRAHLPGSVTAAREAKTLRFFDTSGK